MRCRRPFPAATVSISKDCILTHKSAPAMHVTLRRKSSPSTCSYSACAPGLPLFLKAYSCLLDHLCDKDVSITATIAMTIPTIMEAAAHSDTAISMVPTMVFAGFCLLGGAITMAFVLAKRGKGEAHYGLLDA